MKKCEAFILRGSHRVMCGRPAKFIAEDPFGARYPLCGTHRRKMERVGWIITDLNRSKSNE